MMTLCINCDKRLTRQEVENLTAFDYKYHFVLCTKCRKEYQAEIDAIIDEPEPTWHISGKSKYIYLQLVDNRYGNIVDRLFTEEEWITIEAVYEYLNCLKATCSITWSR